MICIFTNKREIPRRVTRAPASSFTPAKRQMSLIMVRICSVPADCFTLPYVRVLLILQITALFSSPRVPITIRRSGWCLAFNKISSTEPDSRPLRRKETTKRTIGSRIVFSQCWKPVILWRTGRPDRSILASVFNFDFY